MNEAMIAPCPNCGREARHTRYLHRPGYVMRRCTACGVIALVPAAGAPAVPAPASENDSVPGPEGNCGECWDFDIHRAVAGAHLKRAARLLAWAERLAGRRGPLRVLDVGCGLGFLVRAALDCGHEARGLDVCEEAVRSAGELCGRERISAGRIEDGLPAGPFDTVFCMSVIEHLADPGALFSRARAVLGPQGILIVETPTADGLVHVVNRLAYVVSGGRLSRPSLGPGGHLWLFAPRSLAALGRRCGFTPLAMRRTAASLREMLQNARLLQGWRSLHRLGLMVLWPAAAAVHRPHCMAMAFQAGPG